VTLHGLFTRAAHPARVHVGVVQQNAEGDVDCVQRYCEMLAADRPAADALRRKGGGGPEVACPFLSHITVKRFTHLEAKGPTWARAQDREMLRDEHEFCLRTDSHMAFAIDWDVHQLRQWGDVGNEFGILSTCVRGAPPLSSSSSSGERL
jgi:hypothetical protein